MTRIIQKGSDDYYKMAKTCLKSFALVAVASSSLVGCVGLGDGLTNTSYNVTNTATDQLTRVGKWMVGSDEVCARTSQMNATRNDNGTATRGNAVGVRGNCIEPQKQTEFEKENAKIMMLQAENQAKIQLKQAETQAKIQQMQMDFNAQAAIKQDCQNLYRQTFVSGTPMPENHPCITSGMVTPIGAGGVVMPAKKDPAALKQQGGQQQKQFESNPFSGKFWGDRFNQ